MEEKTEARLAVLEEFKRVTETALKVVQNDIREIKDKLLSRPTWFITILITALCTLSVGLIIKLCS